MHILNQEESAEESPAANSTLELANDSPINSTNDQTNAHSRHSTSITNHQGQQNSSNNHNSLPNNVHHNNTSRPTPAAAAAAAAAAAVSPPNSTSTPTEIPLASIHSLHPQRDLKLNCRFLLLPSNDQIRELQTVLRDRATNRGDFKFFADRLIRLVVEEGLNQLPIEQEEVTTPTGHVFSGIRYRPGNCGVSIVRSGESMEQGLRDCCRSIRIGKILIESDEKNQARVLYTKFPKDIAQRKILLLYPIMSTGLAVKESVKVLLGNGCREHNLILLNLFSSPRAAKMINKNFPNMSVLTSDISRICPNHYATRYFGTE